MDKAQLVEIARLYYEKKLTQQEIALKMGTSRMAISRAINKCHLEGIVEVKINYENSYVVLEEEVIKKYKLKKVKIVPSDTDKEISNKFLREGAAKVLRQYIYNNQAIGIGWGNTLHELHRYVSESYNEFYPNTVFVPLLGGYGKTNLKVNANNIASSLAECFKSESLMLHAPAIVDNKDLKISLCSDRHIQEVFKHYEHLDLAVIGIGSPSYKEATVYQSGYFSYGDIKELQDNNIQCDMVSSIYIDGKGKEHPLELLERTIGISGEAFKKIPLVVAVAGGNKKHMAIKLALESSYIDILVTDENTARSLL